MKCAVLGSGSSVNDFDFSSIEGFYVIGVNLGVRLHPCDAMVFLDADMVEDHSDDIVDFKGDIYCSDRAAARIHELNLPVNFISFKNQYNNIAKDWCDPIIGMMSGLAALNIALLLGYKEIYLIGFDLYPGHVFENEYEKRGIHSDQTYAHEWTMNKIVNKFELFKDVDAKIYNCNPHSRIKTFPFQIP